MSDLKKLAAEGTEHLKYVDDLMAKAKASGDENVIALCEVLAESVHAITGLIQMVDRRDAMLAEMSGALAQIMGTAAEPEDKARAGYFKEGMSRARGVQEMYSRQLGSG